MNRLLLLTFGAIFILVSLARSDGKMIYLYYSFLKFSWALNYLAFAIKKVIIIKAKYRRLTIQKSRWIMTDSSLSNWMNLIPRDLYTVYASSRRKSNNKRLYLQTQRNLVCGFLEHTRSFFGLTYSLRAETQLGLFFLDDAEVQPDVGINERGISCRCDSDGPSVQGNSLSGTVWVGSCPSGWKKCVGYYTIVADCCKRGWFKSDVWNQNFSKFCSCPFVSHGWLVVW